MSLTFRTPDSDSPSMRGKFFVMGAQGWLFILLITMLAGVGVAMLYSVGDMSWTPWAGRHATRYALLFALMLALALLPLRLWMTAAYPAYFVWLLLLVAVELYGTTAMGATRWIEIGPFRHQPSEFVKLTTVMAIAKYYNDIPYSAVRSGFPIAHVPPLMMIAVPALLIVRQPDLGTALLLVGTGAVLIFLSGLRWHLIIAATVFGAIGMFGLYAFGLRDYQRQRILSFLNPDLDPMGAGYHTLQSRIAIGSGGLRGKGLGEGTQTRLEFLPEEQTDFIFTVIGEELGLVGGVAVLALVAAILFMGMMIAVRSRSQFGRLAAMGVMTTFAFYVFINTAMVMGLAPVVGVPLPLVSYGGSVMLAVMTSFALVLSIHVNRDVDTAKGRGFFSRRN